MATAKVKKVKTPPTPDKVFDAAHRALTEKLGKYLYGMRRECLLPVGEGLSSFKLARDFSKVDLSFYADSEINIGQLLTNIKTFQDQLFKVMGVHLFVDKDSIRFTHESSYEDCSHYLVMVAEVDSWDEADTLKPLLKEADDYLAEKAAEAKRERLRKEAEKRIAVENAERETLARLKAKYE